jgi:hypothetical protein
VAATTSAWRQASKLGEGRTLSIPYQQATASWHRGGARPREAVGVAAMASVWKQAEGIWGDDAIGKDAGQRAWSGNDGDARDHRSGGNEQLYAPVRRYVVHLHLEHLDVPPSSRIAVNCATPAIGRPSPSLAPGGYGDSGLVRVVPSRSP